MDRGFGEMKEMLTGIDSRVRRLENSEAGCQPLVNARLDAAWRKIEEHSADIEELEKAQKSLLETISELKQANRILTWIGGLLGSAVVLWVVSQLLALVIAAGGP